MSVNLLEKRNCPTRLTAGSLDRGTQDEPTRLGGLVLARQVGQSIMIGDSILIEVIALRSNMVRLRIAAPRSLGVHRREVYDAIRLGRRVDGCHPLPEPNQLESSKPVARVPEGNLILSRHTGETIMIGDSIAVDVVEARPGTTRLRIIAPRSVSVHRREVYDAIRGFDQT